MGFQFCPHCGGKLPSEEIGARFPKPEEPAAPRSYDGPKYWRGLIERSQLNRHMELDVTRTVKRIVDEADKAPISDQGNGVMGLNGIVHLILDRDVVPHGGVFLKAMQMLSTPNGMTAGPRLEDGATYLKQHGYVVQDGKVVLVNDVPVGPAYLLLEEWGGKEHYRDWNMTLPIDLQASRSGNPYFFDENMISFGVHFSTKEDVGPSLGALLARFKTEGVCGLVDIGVFWQ